MITKFTLASQVQTAIQNAQDAAEEAQQVMRTSITESYNEACQMHLECKMIEMYCKFFLNRAEKEDVELAMRTEAMKADQVIKNHLNQPDANTHAHVKAAATMYRLIAQAGHAHLYTGASQAIAYAATSDSLPFN